LGVAVLLGGLGIWFGSAGEAWAAYDVMAFLAAGVVFCAQIILVDTRKGVLVTALLAAFCNGYLLNMKFAPGKAICDAGEVISCSGVNDSAASMLFGLPVTLFGLAFYIGLGLASLRGVKSSPRFDQINGLFAIGSLVFSAYLGWEAKKLGLVCPMCITIYACNALLLWSAFKGLKENGGTLFGGMDKVFGASSLWIVTATFAFITLIGASSWSSRQASDPGAIAQAGGAGATLPVDKLQLLYKRPDGPIALDGTEPLLGRSQAPITIVEFADYGCPHCAMAAPVLKELVANNPDAKLYFKAFPLSGACNPVIGNPEVGVERCKAAMAAECAGDQGRYFEMSATLFKSLDYREDSDLLFMAKDIGLDEAAWTQCMQAQGTVEAVQADAMAGANARVAGTPAMFVKGLVGDDWIEITQGPEAIVALMKAKANGVVLPPPS
jgi:protein-disulfide isomerase